MPDRWLGVYPSLAPTVYLRRPRRRLPFPLDDPACRLYSRARSGLEHALTALGVGPGDEVLAPAYHHGTEIETLVRIGASPRFYEARPGLAPDPEELESALGPRVRALYLIHYWGFPQDTRRWRQWCDERGLLMIEDGAHALLSEDAAGPLGSLGDASIFCAYKVFGLPDGGLAWSRTPPVPPTGPARSGLARLDRSHRNWLAQRFRPLGRLRAGSRDAHEYVETPERDFGSVPTEPPAAMTSLLLKRAVDPRAADRRRDHYRYLAARLNGLVSSAFPPLAPACSPLALPVESRRKLDLLEHLAARGVIDGKMWMTPHPAVPVDRFPGAAALRERLVALPVHQELRRADLDRIVDAVRSAPWADSEGL
jgi:dTDP-4-amino-4,6-dideoxygalactose transaminase